MPISKRGQQWLHFASKVLSHIEKYTVPQYGDLPDDQASEFTIKEMQMNIKRYLNRMTSNARGSEEARRDMLKVAHYACLTLAKLEEGE